MLRLKEQNFCSWSRKYLELVHYGNISGAFTIPAVVLGLVDPQPGTRRVWIVCLNHSSIKAGLFAWPNNGGLFPLLCSHAFLEQSRRVVLGVQVTTQREMQRVAPHRTSKSRRMLV